MHPDLSHAFALLGAAVRDVSAPHHQTADTWEAITTLEAVDEHRADTLWGILGWEAGGQRRHQGGRLLEVLRGQAGQH